MDKKKRMVLGILMAGLLGAYIGCGDDDGVQQNQPVAPTINSITPNTVSIGQRNVEGQILGANLSGVTGVSFGDGIGVASYSAVSDSQINVVFHVDANAFSGARTVVVETPSGSGSSATIFQVTNNKAPRARFTMDPPAGSLQTVFTVDASNSEDDNGSIRTFRFDFGDGTVANGKKLTHQFRQLGTYTVKLTVTDNAGTTDTLGKDVEILRNSPPVPIFSVSPGKGTTFTAFAFDASRSEDADGRIVDYRWDFGDGKRGNGEDVNHTYAKEGDYDVSLTVEDNKGETGSLRREVEVDKQNGVKCAGRPGKGDGYPFKVITADRSTRTLLVQFNQDYGCKPHWRCGDVRKGGYPGVSPGKEYWVGIMCEFVDLGGGMAQIKTALGNYWPQDGEGTFYTWAQTDCSLAPCP